MKVILGAVAISVDGFIAKKNDDTSWISKEEWDGFSLMVRKAGNLIVGHRTYNILTKQPEFAELKDVQLVVVAHQDFQTLTPNHRVAHSPKEALELLKDFATVIIAGGSHLNATFLAEGLIDEIYLDIEPIILGQGIPLFNSGNFDIRLQLLEHKKISDNEIQLHYKVLK